MPFTYLFGITTSHPIRTDPTFTYTFLRPHKWDIINSYTTYNKNYAVNYEKVGYLHGQNTSKKSFQNPMTDFENSHL